MMGNPESAASYKKLSQDAARIIREELTKKLGKDSPELEVLNAKYSALRDYMDNTSKGLSGSVNRGIMSAGAQGALNAVNMVLQGTTDIGKAGGKLMRDMRFKQGNFVPKK